MLGHAPNGRFVSTSGARPGDVVVQVGPVPIEGAAVLAAEASDRLAELQRDVVGAAAVALDCPGDLVEAADDGDLHQIRNRFVVEDDDELQAVPKVNDVLSTAVCGRQVLRLRPTGNRACR